MLSKRNIRVNKHGSKHIKKLYEYLVLYYWYVLLLPFNTLLDEDKYDR